MCHSAVTADRKTNRQTQRKFFVTHQNREFNTEKEKKTRILVFTGQLKMKNLWVKLMLSLSLIHTDTCWIILNNCQAKDVLFSFLDYCKSTKNVMDIRLITATLPRMCLVSFFLCQIFKLLWKVQLKFSQKLFVLPNRILHSHLATASNIVCCHWISTILSASRLACDKTISAFFFLKLGQNNAVSSCDF